MEISRTALLSCSSKDFAFRVASLLTNWKWTIFASGGTSQFLLEKGIRSTPLEQLTGFGSLLQGRVKTLDSKILAGVLAKESDLLELQNFKVPKFDLVCVDFYPPQKGEIESIDIGGPTLLRAAAKNFANTLAFPPCLPVEELQEEFEKEKGNTSLAFRREAAIKTFEFVARYDIQVLEILEEKSELKDLPLLPKTKLRYGENSHQRAFFLGSLPQSPGKELSYNNILDCSAAIRLISQFEEPACAILKHQNPCAVVSRKEDLDDLVDKTLAVDEQARFGGVFILNQTLNASIANRLIDSFWEVILAQRIESEARNILLQKKNLRILEYPSLFPTYLFKSALGGLLCQEADTAVLTQDNLLKMTDPPSPSAVQDAIFALKVARHCHSNAIVIAKEGETLGFGIGQTSRIRSVKMALDQARSKNLEGAVLASDGFFPFSDSMELLKGLDLGAVVAPSGSIRDSEVVEACRQIGVPLLFSNLRLFSHG